MPLEEVDHYEWAFIILALQSLKIEELKEKGIVAGCVNKVEMLNEIFKDDKNILFNSN